MKSFNLKEDSNEISQEAAVQKTAASKKYYYLSVVIPARNEENRIGKTLEEIIGYLKLKPFDSEILVIDDSSEDKTAALAESFKKDFPDTRVLSLKKHRGKGGAVKEGIKESSGKYILFTDADNSTPIEEFDKFISLMERGDILIGSRYAHGSIILKPQSLTRRFVARCANFLIRLLLLKEIKDSRCGFKLFKREAALELIKNQTIETWSFDTELLCIAKIKKLKIAEIPVVWRHTENGNLKPFLDSLRGFKEILQIKWNILTGKYLD